MLTSNMSLAWIILELCLNTFDVAFTVYFGVNKRTMSDWVKRKHLILSFIILFIVFSSFQFFTSLNLLSTYVYLLLFLTFTILFNEKNKFQGFFYGVSIYLVIIVITIVSMATILWGYDLKFSEFYYNSDYRIPTLAIRIILMSIVGVYINYKSKKAKSDFEVFDVYILVNAIALTVLLIGIAFDQRVLVKEYIQLFVFSSVLVFVCLFAIYLRFRREILFYKKTKNEIIETHSSEVKEIIHEAHATLSHALKLTTLTRKDVLTVAKTFFDVDDLTEIGLLKEKVRQGVNVLEGFLRAPHETGNEVVDTVILINTYHVAHFNIAIEVTGEINNISQVSSEYLALIVFYIMKLGEEHLRNAPQNIERIIELSFLNNEEEFFIEGIFPMANKSLAEKVTIPKELAYLASIYKGKMTSEKNHEFCNLRIAFPNSNFYNRIDSYYWEKISKKGGEYREIV